MRQRARGSPAGERHALVNPRQPTSFKTNSFYVNDRWQLNDRWSFNLGVRYDENDGIDSSGAVVADHRKISPRLGLNWDVKGDGDLLVNASYGTYVAALPGRGACWWSMTSRSSARF